MMVSYTLEKDVAALATTYFFTHSCHCEVTSPFGIRKTYSDYQDMSTKGKKKRLNTYQRPVFNALNGQITSIIQQTQRPESEITSYLVTGRKPTRRQNKKGLSTLRSKCTHPSPISRSFALQGDRDCHETLHQHTKGFAIIESTDLLKVRQFGQPRSFMYLTSFDPKA